MIKDGLLSHIDPASLVEENKPLVDVVEEQPTESSTYADKSIVDAIVALLTMLRTGSPSQRHDAAKAVGYIGKLGALPAAAKMEVKNTIVDILMNERPTMGVAFAMLESLERIDSDAFYTLIMSWYAQMQRHNVAHVLKSFADTEPNKIQK